MGAWFLGKKRTTATYDTGGQIYHRYYPGRKGPYSDTRSHHDRAQDFQTIECVDSFARQVGRLINVAVLQFANSPQTSLNRPLAWVGYYTSSSSTISGHVSRTLNVE